MRQGGHFHLEEVIRHLSDRLDIPDVVPVQITVVMILQSVTQGYRTQCIK